MPTPNSSPRLKAVGFLYCIPAKLSIYGSAGAAACGRQQLSNSNNFTEPYTLKKPIRIDFWADAYMNLGNYGWKYVTIPAGTKLQNFPFGYSCNS